jgi:polyhydroxybutyrate depolymerase
MTLGLVARRITGVYRAQMSLRPNGTTWVAVRAALAVGVSLGGCSLITQPASPPLDGVVVDGLTRTFTVHKPDGLDSRTPAPLFIVLHGLGGNGFGVRDDTGFDRVADRYGFIVAYPDAWEPAGRAWALDCRGCTAADTLGINDLRFIDAMIADIASRYSIDRSRVFATGFSLGGWLTYALACKRPATFAGVATVGATLPVELSKGCTPPSSLSFMLMLGTADPAMPWEGHQRGSYVILGADSTTRHWAGVNGCATTPTVRDIPDRDGDRRGATVSTFGACRSSAEVRLYRFDGAGHYWPSGDVDGSDEIARVLLRR